MAALVGATLLAAVACQAPIGGPPGRPPRGNTSWPLPNLDLGNTRDASDSPIDSHTVGRLRPAWSSPLPGPGSYGNASTNPIVVGGAVYLEDLSGNVRKFDQRTGALVWSSNQSDTGKPMIGPNGVAVDTQGVRGVGPRRHRGPGHRDRAGGVALDGGGHAQPRHRHPAHHLPGQGVRGRCRSAWPASTTAGTPGSCSP